MTAAAAGHRESGSGSHQQQCSALGHRRCLSRAGRPGARVDGWKLPEAVLPRSRATTLRRLGLPAFREPVEAWTHGPVIDRLYQEHKRRRFVETLGESRFSSGR